jgi:hypothetical protein
MLVRDGPGFFVKRLSWSHPRTIARIAFVDRGIVAMLRYPPPYFGNPAVWADVAYQGVIRRQALDSPGTYSYRQVDRPTWWPGPVCGSEATLVAVPSHGSPDGLQEAIASRPGGTVGHP